MEYRINLKRAREILRPFCNPRGAEPVKLWEAYGRIASRDVFADADMPLCDIAATDGFAFASSVSVPATLKIPAQAVKLNAGMPVPEGFDTLAAAETVQATLFEAAVTALGVAGANITAQGSDIRAGELILSVGEQIGAEQVRKLSAQGVAELEVYRRPRIGIISIGDDVVDITAMPQPGQVRDSNRYVLECVLREWGCDTYFLGLADETYQADVTQAIVSLINRGRGLDAMIMTGGAAFGDNDFIAAAFAAIGAFDLTWGGDFAPGGTFAMACLGITPLVGLSGNPHEMYSTLTNVLQPALLQLTGRNTE